MNEQDWQEVAMGGVARTLFARMQAHDGSTGKHMQQVGALLFKLTRALGLRGTAAQRIVLAGWLHDIGKLAIPGSILTKPGPLTPEEWAIMRTHAALGAEFVSGIARLRPLAPLIRAHHERWDGGGYPDGLVGEEIPSGARLIAVVDAYLAMTEDRPYRQARSQVSAVAELRRCAGTQFDPLAALVLASLLIAGEPVRNLAEVA